MQQQKEMMDSITTRQLAVLHKQEEQIEQLIQKHLQKQMEAEAIVEKQMQQINDIILVKLYFYIATGSIGLLEFHPV